MLLTELIWFIASSCVAACLTWVVRHHAVARGMLDIPNARSSHQLPTPRGGGSAVVITIVLGSLALGCAGLLDTSMLIALLPSGAAIALIGYIDDRHGLRVAPRFAVHLGAAFLTMALFIHGNGTSEVFALLPDAMVVGLVVLGTVWSVNLFNFMDGIDGIAGSQAVFVSGASGLLIAFTNGPVEWSVLCAITAGGGAGFLIWNWPPAKIFMGDVGSGFLGFWLAALAVALHLGGALNIWSSLVLGMLFIADATATLIRRMLSGEKWYEAHRSHAYQHLARRLGGHLPVTLSACLMNLVVLLPAAFVAQEHQAYGPFIAGCAFAVFVVLCLSLGAGQPEKRHHITQSARL